MRKNFRAFTLIELLIVVAIIAILAAIAVPNFLEAQTRSKVSRVRSDMRSLATGLESYYIDNNQYPAVFVNGPVPFVQSVNSAFRSTALPANIEPRSFRLRVNNSLSTLTTPVAYLTSYTGDPFADTRGLSFGYFADGPGWILTSYGPNTDESQGGDLGIGRGTTLTPDDREALSIETIYNSGVSQPSSFLITGFLNFGSGNRGFTYDPTNGTVSSGDIWRVKQ